MFTTPLFYLGVHLRKDRVGPADEVAAVARAALVDRTQ